MSKKRAALKYSALSLVTAGYGGAVWKVFQAQGQPREPISSRDVQQVAICAVTLTGLTWLVAKL